MTDFRALCAELVEKLDEVDRLLHGAQYVEHPLTYRARTALAQPEPEGPTQRQLFQLAAEFWPEGGEPTQAVPFARAVLARWGRPAPLPTDELLQAYQSGRRDAEADAQQAAEAAQPVADGEVAELVAYLRADTRGSYHTNQRIADLLERLSPPQPIPVSERLPGPEDCDADGRCWLLTVEDDYPQWRLHSIQGAQPGGAMIWVPVDSSPGVMVDCFYTSHWLPAHALPVPGNTSGNV